MELDKAPLVIKTKRLTIRFVDLADAKDYFVFCSNPNVCRYLSFEPYKHVFQAKKAINNMIRSYLVNKDINFSIILNETNRVIGSISLSINDFHCADLGYLLDEKYWNKKIMSETVPEIIKVAFDYYKIDTLYAKYVKDNQASEKLLMNNGFKQMTINHGAFEKNNQVYDIYVTRLDNHYNL